MIDYTQPVEEFIRLYQTHIKRPGAEKFLEFLRSSKSDFFTAPASTRYHLSEAKGLVIHSLHVYECLVAYLNEPRVKDVYQLHVSMESIAICALLHDVCKVNVYRPSKRNVKDEDGRWKEVATYDFRDDLPYGHGEKSVYIISGFFPLTREEAFAIRYHMGFSGNEDKNNVSSAFEKFPLAFALSLADMEATFFVEKNNG